MRVDFHHGNIPSKLTFHQERGGGGQQSWSPFLTLSPEPGALSPPRICESMVNQCARRGHQADTNSREAVSRHVVRHSIVPVESPLITFGWDRVRESNRWNSGYSYLREGEREGGGGGERKRGTERWEREGGGGEKAREKEVGERWEREVGEKAREGGDYRERWGERRGRDSEGKREGERKRERRGGGGGGGGGKRQTGRGGGNGVK